MEGFGGGLPPNPLPPEPKVLRHAWTSSEGPLPDSGFVSPDEAPNFSSQFSAYGHDGSRRRGLVYWTDNHWRAGVFREETGWLDLGEDFPDILSAQLAAEKAIEQLMGNANLAVGQQVVKTPDQDGGRGSRGIVQY